MVEYMDKYNRKMLGFLHNMASSRLQMLWEGAVFFAIFFILQVKLSLACSTHPCHSQRPAQCPLVFLTVYNWETNECAVNCSLLGAGAFVGPDGKTLPVPENLPNAHMRLFGGAQYHRAMAEFRNGIGNLTCPDISREEIVNACGIDDFHDGVNYTRTACVIAVSKARDVFEPFLHQVGGLAKLKFGHITRQDML